MQFRFKTVIKRLESASPAKKPSSLHMLSPKMRREEVGLFDEGQSGGRDSLTLKVLETPSHSPKTTMGLSLRSPSMTSIASMGSLSTPASSIFGEGSSVKVRVSVPDELPATGPVFFEVEVRSAALRKIIVVQRRFKAFDALASKLQWDRVAIGAPDLPPKYVVALHSARAHANEPCPRFALTWSLHRPGAGCPRPGTTTRPSRRAHLHCSSGPLSCWRSRTP